MSEVTQQFLDSVATELVEMSKDNGAFFIMDHGSLVIPVDLERFEKSLRSHLGRRRYFRQKRRLRAWLRKYLPAEDRDRVLACLRDGSFGLARMALIRVQAEIDSYYHENQMGN